MRSVFFILGTSFLVEYFSMGDAHVTIAPSFGIIFITMLVMDMSDAIVKWKK